MRDIESDTAPKAASTGPSATNTIVKCIVVASLAAMMLVAVTHDGNALPTQEATALASAPTEALSPEMQLASAELETNLSAIPAFPSTCEEMTKWIATYLPQLRDHAQQIKDPSERDANLETLEELAMDAPVNCNNIKKEEAAAREDSAQTEKNQEMCDAKMHGKKAPTFLQAAPEDADLRELHDELQAVLKEHKIDSQTTRLTMSPQQHNEAVATFFTHLAMGTHIHGTADDDTPITALVYGGGKGALAAKCMNGIAMAAPPNFCYKSGKHNHEVPTKCASGWRRNMAECFRDCRSGYYFVGGGTCWQHCKDGYKDHGATCYKSFFKWYFKKSYWTDRKTNFHDESQCNHSDQYKSGAMCYKRCETYGETPNSLEGCGFDACASSAASCASTIFNMVAEIGFAIASLVSLGTFSALKVAARGLVKKLGSSGVKAVSKGAVNAIMRSGTREFVKASSKNAMKAVKKEGKDWIKSTAIDGWTENAVKNLCQHVASNYYNKLTKEPAPFNPAMLDPTGIAAAVTSCEKGKEDTMACKAAIVGAMGTFDPTGFLGVAAAFMHDKCAEPSAEPGALDWPAVSAPAASAPAAPAISAPLGNSLVGRTISLRGSHKNQFCADEGNVVKCNRNNVGDWEKFTVHDAGNGQIALKGGKDKKYCADDGKNIACNRNSIGDWEKFTIVDAGGGKKALKGRQNKYCCDMQNRLECDRASIGDWEKFTIGNA